MNYEIKEAFNEIMEIPPIYRRDYIGGTVWIVMTAHCAIHGTLRFALGSTMRKSYFDLLEQTA